MSFHNKTLITRTVAATVLLSGLVGGAALLAHTAAAQEGIEACAGIARSGMNDCATAAHSCAGQAKTDRDPADFVDLPAGICGKIAGGRVL